MDPIRQINSTCVPLPVDNVDTDQIIPARFLKATTREGFGDNLFRDWRYDASGAPRADFVLNDPTYSGTVLLAGENFGCGSSREHAAWALYDYGFRVILARSFADIFKSNALNNGLLPIAVDQEFYDALLKSIQDEASTRVWIDLQSQSLRNETTGVTVTFDINPYKKHCLLHGLDDIDYLLSIADEIDPFELQRRQEEFA